MFVGMSQLLHICIYVYRYSPCKAFKMVMTEVNDMAGQHEVIAENLQADVIREVTILIKDFKDERKKVRAICTILHVHTIPVLFSHNINSDLYLHSTQQFLETLKCNLCVLVDQVLLGWQNLLEIRQVVDFMKLGIL